MPTSTCQKTPAWICCASGRNVSVFPCPKPRPTRSWKVSSVVPSPIELCKRRPWKMTSKSWLSMSKPIPRSPTPRQRFWSRRPMARASLWSKTAIPMLANSARGDRRGGAGWGDAHRICAGQSGRTGFGRRTERSPLPRQRHLQQGQEAAKREADHYTLWHVYVQSHLVVTSNGDQIDGISGSIAVNPQMT